MTVEEWQENNAKMEDIAKKLIPNLIGKTLEEARTAANEKELPHRVVQIDGEGCMVTCDLIGHRLNFYVENEIVTKINLA